MYERRIIWVRRLIQFDGTCNTFYDRYLSNRHAPCMSSHRTKRIFDSVPVFISVRKCLCNLRSFLLETFKLRVNLWDSSGVSTDAIQAYHPSVCILQESSFSTSFRLDIWQFKGPLGIQRLVTNCQLPNAFLWKQFVFVYQIHLKSNTFQLKRKQGVTERERGREKEKRKT